MKHIRTGALAAICLYLSTFLTLAAYGVETQPPAKPPTIEDLQKKVDDLTNQVKMWQAIASTYRTEAAQARQQLDDTAAQTAGQAILNPPKAPTK